MDVYVIYPPWSNSNQLCLFTEGVYASLMKKLIWRRLRLVMKWTTTTCQHKKNSLRWLVSLMSAVMKFAQGRTTGKTQVEAFPFWMLRTFQDCAQVPKDRVPLEEKLLTFIEYQNTTRFRLGSQPCLEQEPVLRRYESNLRVHIQPDPNASFASLPVFPVLQVMPVLPVANASFQNEYKGNRFRFENMYWLRRSSVRLKTWALSLPSKHQLLSGQ